jgi:hypothetical protein
MQRQANSLSLFCIMPGSYIILKLKLLSTKYPIDCYIIQIKLRENVHFSSIL